ncbi:hypothetical protein [Rheinheimera sp. UJ63]|uniref:hypothetical protein n=1 Tax=Rheinheimera sp. UJ63 TaxID=2910157 RepID=UPI001F458707|nr:hypothetical protein [Rheinheimera sp. UJ63]MCF4009584.1 hypothetical protein [Rheinheimera sp. UJ63]
MTAVRHISDKAPLVLNADHSSSIHDATLTTLSITQTALRHLDLMQVKALQQLHICSTVPAERHLRIQGASALQQVLLQGHSENRWVLHLDLADFPHGLHIIAPVSQLDMCWLKEGELLTLAQKPPQQLWQQIYFYDLNQMWLDDFTTLQNLPKDSLLIFSGGYQQAMAPAFANLRQLVFTDIAGIACLTLSGCQYLAVQRAIGLRSIAILDNELHNIQLQHCPQFSRLTAPADFSAQHAQLTDAAHSIVDFAGSWQSVKLRRSALTELNSGNIAQLHVSDCPNLVRLRAGSPLVFSSGIFAPELLDQASFSINEATIRDALNKLTEQLDTELIEALLTQAARQSKPHNVYHAIMLLQAFADLGFAVDRLWDIRCALYLQNQQRPCHFKQAPSKITPHSWRWKIKKDRIFESYEADFLLWLAAYRQALSDTADFMRTAVHSALLHEPAAFHTLCNMLSKDDSPLHISEKLAFIQQLIQQKTTHTHTWLTLNNTLLPGLKRLSQLFIKLCQPHSQLSEEQQTWRFALFDFLSISLSPKFLAEILPSAMQAMPEYARPKLLAMANHSELPHVAKMANVSFESVKVWYAKAALARG